MPRLALHWQILIGMIIGAAIGLTLNFTASEHEREIFNRQQFADDDDIADVQKKSLPDDVEKVEFHDSRNRIDIYITSADSVKHVVVDPSGDAKGSIESADGTTTEIDSVVTLKKLASEHPQAHSLFQKHGRSTSRWIGDASNRIGGLFLRMLRMVAVPLIVSSLITGVMGVGSAGRLGSMFGRTAVYYICTSLLAIVTGLAMVNLIRPGLKEGLKARAGDAPSVSGNLGETLWEQLETMIPSNPFAALAAPNFLSIISFSLAFAIFAILVGGKTADTVRDFFRAVFDVMMAMTMAIIKLAPIGVMFLMLFVTATQGPNVFMSLAWYMVTVLCALAFHAIIVLPLILKFVARRNPLKFAQAMSPALLTAFSSASSNATLPLTMASVEERAGVSNKTGSFVLPLGATINMDGTALYEAVAVLFIAQLHYGYNLPLDQQIIVALTALLASIGAAGIPHAGLVMMVIILQAVGLPLELQGIIIAVDRVLDMCRTSVNVWSDSCGCAVVERFEAADK